MRSAESRYRLMWTLAILGAALGAGASARAQSTSATTGGPPVRFSADFRVSGDARFSNNSDQEETTIAVNPRDPLNLVAGYHDTREINPIPGAEICRFAYSTDGGATWTAGGQTPLEEEPSQTFCADPSIAADANGVFYYAYLDVNGPTSTVKHVDLLVARSTDGGRTFPAYSVAAVQTETFPDIDKPYMGVDVGSKSRFKGAIYVSFTHAEADIRVVTSRDGARTWSAPSVLESSQGVTFVQGSLPVVAPDGSVYVFWAKYDLGSGPTNIRFARSQDGGKSWTVPQDVASGLPSPGEFRLKNDDPNFGITPGHGLLSNSLPTAAIAPNGDIFVAWTDFTRGSCNAFGLTSTNAAACTNSDVRLAVSRNAGKSWTAPIKVSDETGASDQFFPWIATHPNGLLSLMWVDRRLDPNNVNYDIFYTNTFDG